MESKRFAYRVREAALALGLGVTMTRRLIAAGTLKSIRVGKRILVPEDAIRAFFEHAARTSASQKGGARD
jgi:excisionase family DNA binding protein